MKKTKGFLVTGNWVVSDISISDPVTHKHKQEKSWSYTCKYQKDMNQ